MRAKAQAGEQTIATLEQSKLQASVKDADATEAHKMVEEWRTSTFQLKDTL